MVFRTEKQKQNKTKKTENDIDRMEKTSPNHPTEGRKELIGCFSSLIIHDQIKFVT